MLSPPVAVVCHDLKPSRPGNFPSVVSQQPHAAMGMSLTAPTKVEDNGEQGQAARLRGGRRGRCFLGNLLCVC
ncbi:hypothetical protein BD626DRAFT_566599 [Schizophyllum amplum]|uniref:Uncharacterized protein n=1 Tax=Schizophyllum amplum TaxID=97359 RepID=A0A550CMH0_9AGAR|nr:hypothetical protein BD626DRAFT_566599 [Auriculariopsis ampla]